jgi:HAD superfamily hydrolase (TIGR01484 family)
MKTMIAFDLDGTLAESKQAIPPEMAERLESLLGVADVAVISGGDWPQFQTQVVSQLPESADLKRLWIMPTTGTKLYRYEDGEWKAIYADVFDADERQKIAAALDQVMREKGYDQGQTWGERIEDRGSQITFSALGQEAPLSAKKDWDPDFAKRKDMQGDLVKMLPGLSINMGGSTSIDITREGVDKAYGMHKLAEHAGISFENILFMGDAIFPGGNDYPVSTAGIDVIRVRDPEDTAVAIRAVVACLKD